MESSDDDGESVSAVTITKASLIFLFCLPAALYKPHQKTDYFQPVTTTAPKKEIVVTAIEPAKPKNKKKKVYLTFDDGPNKGTKNVLTIVKDENVPVSFFIVGEHVFASIGQQRTWDSLKMAKQIELCNHSFSHAHCHYEKYYQSPDSVVSDFRRTKDSLGLDNDVARTPGRNTWRIDTLKFTDLKKTTAAADSLQNAGFVLMGWDLEWQFDHKTMSVTNTAEKMIAEIDSAFKHNRTKSSDHLVLLAHDQAYVKSDDSLQLRQFFQLLKKRDDFELMLVGDYPGVSKNPIDSLR
jgi:peptidoglycan-N-acetylglucosamine deacetylase